MAYTEKMVREMNMLRITQTGTSSHGAEDQHDEEADQQRYVGKVHRPAADDQLAFVKLLYLLTVRETNQNDGDQD